MSKFRLFIYAIILSLTVFFTGPVFLHGEGINDDLKPYWDREIDEIKKTCPNLDSLLIKVVVDFGDTDDAIGYCQRYPNGFKIILNKSYWNRRLNDTGKRQLLLHEMMHCIFKVGHNTTDPDHFMYPEYTPIKKEDLLIQMTATIKQSDRCN